MGINIYVSEDVKPFFIEKCLSLPEMMDIHALSEKNVIYTVDCCKYKPPDFFYINMF